VAEPVAGGGSRTPAPAGLRQRLAALLDAPRPPTALLAASGLALALEYLIDFSRHRQLAVGVLVVHGAVALATVVLVVAQAIRGGVRRFARERWGDVAVVVAVVAAAALGLLRVAGALCALRNLWRFVAHVTARVIDRRVAPVLFARPMALLTLSFALTILAGTVALMVPAATTDGKGARFLDALFTATSAVCVTGLTVVDTGTHFTRFGHWVLMILIQVGGLGIMTITSALALALRAGLSTRMGGAMREIIEESSPAAFRRTLYSIIVLTVSFEVLGALSLYATMRVGPTGAPLAFGDRVFHAAFHAVSAFCNAGFGLHSDNLVRYVGNVPVNATICSLIVIGGLGFPVLSELLRPSAWRRGVRGFGRSLSVHTRMVLITTGVLITVGAAAFLLLEWSGAMKGLPVPTKGLAAIFHSITYRTAGFNTVDLSGLQPASLLIGMGLMFIGGSPSGTAGGIKTTTFAVLVLAVRAMILRRADVEMHSRTISKTDVYRAVGVAMISGLVLFVVLVFLLIVEADKKFGDVAFEAFSAFGTVGVSTGITPKLSAAGKLAIILLMFLGRVGPFSIALLVGQAQLADYTYPEGKIAVG
jgi:trk system potassium uptake protein TrkH